MATLKEKSATNLNSALLLTSKQETCLSSVHCAYYSCFQLILYYLETAFAYDDAKRKSTYDNYLQTTTGKKLGTHAYWIAFFLKQLKANRHAGNSALINNNIRKLKEARTEADYQETDFDTKKTNVLYDMARDTISLINKSFV